MNTETETQYEYAVSFQTNIISDTRLQPEEVYEKALKEITDGDPFSFSSTFEYDEWPEPDDDEDDDDDDDDDDDEEDI